MKLSYSEMRDLGMAAFKAVGVPEKTAAIVTEALILAELDGMPSHGFNRIPFYAGQAKSGKVVAAAEPEVTQTGPSVVVVDAKYGFAVPAI